MRYAKALSLAAIATFAAMAFVGASSASAQTHKVVLCEELVELCPKGKLWLEGTQLFALAKNPILHSSIGLVTCEDSLVTGKLAETINSPLNIKEPAVVFGTLATLKLGANCTGVCTNGAEENVHAELENLQIEVETKDKYFLKGSGLALLLHCPFDVTCVYRGANILVPITHTGEHLAHPNTKILPLANFNITLNRVNEGVHKSSLICPATATWLADYVLYLAEEAGKKGLAWPSLDLP